MLQKNLISLGLNVISHVKIATLRLSRSLSCWCSIFKHCYWPVEVTGSWTLVSGLGVNSRFFSSRAFLHSCAFGDETAFLNPRFHTITIPWPTFCFRSLERSSVKKKARKAAKASTAIDIPITGVLIHAAQKNTEKTLMSYKDWMKNGNLKKKLSRVTDSFDSTEDMCIFLKWLLFTTSFCDDTREEFLTWFYAWQSPNIRLSRCFQIEDLRKHCGCRHKAEAHCWQLEKNWAFMCLQCAMLLLCLFGWSCIMRVGCCGMKEALSRVAMMNCYSIDVLMEGKAAQCLVMEKTVCCCDTLGNECSIWRKA